jgi:hypothetical protein
MKKIVRLTESDITRIVKRVMNESPLLLGDPNDSYDNDRDSDEDDDDLSDDEFMSKYRNKDIPGWDTPNNKKLNRIRHIRNKNRGGISMDEDLQLLGDPKYRGGNDEWDTPHSEKRIDRELSDKEFYEKYKNKDLGWDTPTNRRLNRLRGIEGNYKKRKGKGMNEALGLLDKKKYSDLPGGIVKRKITDYASAKRYTMGTKVSADLIMRMIDMGGDVFMYTDRSSDKIFVDSKNKRVYNNEDMMVGKITGNMDDWAMDYFDN